GQGKANAASSTGNDGRFTFEVFHGVDLPVPEFSEQDCRNRSMPPGFDTGGGFGDATSGDRNLLRANMRRARGGA
ncbi:MAG: hypothetical protein AAGG11_21360, partial [Pseudomonadota bacterium]